jgi:hypothetical protein
VVDAAIFAGIGWATGRWALAAAGFACLTLVLGVNYNAERLYRRERGEPAEAMPAATGIAALLARVYALVYAPQDRLVERFVAARLRGRSPGARLAYHDRATVSVLANFGLSTQLAALGLCLALGGPAAYAWVAIGCAVALVPLALRRELLLRRFIRHEEVPRWT